MQFSRLVERDASRESGSLGVERQRGPTETSERARYPCVVRASNKQPHLSRADLPIDLSPLPCILLRRRPAARLESLARARKVRDKWETAIHKRARRVPGEVRARISLEIERLKYSRAETRHVDPKNRRNCYSISRARSSAADRARAVPSAHVPLSSNEQPEKREEV